MKSLKRDILKQKYKSLILIFSGFFFGLGRLFRSLFTKIIQNGLLLPVSCFLLGLSGIFGPLLTGILFTFGLLGLGIHCTWCLYGVHKIDWGYEGWEEV